MRATLLAVAAVAAVFSVQADARDAAEIYGKTCVACHASGVANAPKTGDAAAWKPRLDKGMDTLVASVKNGMGAMPAKGMCMDCTDEEYKSLITFMSTAK